MYRQSPGRNHRSKGVRVKNILQICLLLAVCFWLIYQVKHSHDKKKEFDENDAKASLQTATSDELIRFGRKDIRPRVEETITKNENQDESSDDEEANGEDVEDIKHEEDESEEKKVEGKEEDVGEDETDEHEEDKSDGEVDREQEMVDGEEREDADDREPQETDLEDGRVEIEKEGAAEETDHDGDDRSTHEAREEHYKADDASSAVTHENMGNSNEHPENNIVEEENIGSKLKSEDRVEGGEVARDGQPSNVTTSETKIDLLDNSENGSSANNKVPEGSNGHLMSNGTSEFTVENHDLTPENATEIKPDFNHGQANLTEVISDESQNSYSERANNSTLNVDSTLQDSNSTGSAESFSEELSNSSNNSTVLLENNNEIEGEKLDTSEGTDESLETTSSENHEEVQQDAIDISDTEKDVRTDLDTLPEFQTEGTNNEDVAAE